MSVLPAIVAALLRALLPALIQASRKTSEDGDRARQLRNRFRRRISRSWGRVAGVLALCICIATLPGCGGRTIYVPDGTPVRIRQTIKNAKVWVLDKDGQPIAGTIDIPEGWFALALSEEELISPRNEIR